MKAFERVLSRGESGELVSDLQARLIELGYKSCYLSDGSSAVLDEPTGYFGEVTQELLSKFQENVFDVIMLKCISIPFPINLDPNALVNGIMDAHTHYVLMNYEDLSKRYQAELAGSEIELPEEEPAPEEDKTRISIIKSVIELAKGEIGVKEVGGNNYGKRVEEYQRIGSGGVVDGGQPWCQYFMNWLLMNATLKKGIDYLCPTSGYTPFWINWGKQNKLTEINPAMSEIEIGDFMYVYSSVRKSAKHVALVIAKKKSSVITIEGNTNPGGGSDGFGVFQRERPQPWAVVKWHKKYE